MKATKYKGFTIKPFKGGGYEIRKKGFVPMILETFQDAINQIDHLQI